MICQPTAAERPPPADFVLRPLGAADATEAAEVVRAAFSAQSGATRPPSSALRETADSIAAKIAGGGVGAFREGSLVAVVLWQIDADALHLGRFSVLPPFRGRGLARRLMASSEAAARACGASRMRLRVRLELPESERLFERFGFTRCGLETHEGFDAPTTAVMEKRLS
jgi:GNAT superfamily N-acetyltransferase